MCHLGVAPGTRTAEITLCVSIAEEGVHGPTFKALPAICAELPALTRYWSTSGEPALSCEKA